ncbi:MAG: hypothetical protein K2X82_06060 [Gemmataceae bacterium]|nr:hypothetical protein [Gemmataceae bacterium]
MFARKTLTAAAFSAGVCGFSFRAGERSVQATDPNPCPQWNCVEVYAWWTIATDPGKDCSAAHTKGTTKADTTNHDTNAIALLYATSGTNLQATGTADKIERVTYATHVQNCGKFAGTQYWQSPQQVSPSSDPGAIQPMNKSVCKAN